MEIVSLRIKAINRTMYTLLSVVSSILCMAVQAQVEDSLPAFHTIHMLRSYIKTTQPAWDSLRQFASFVTVNPGKTEAYEARVAYPYIELTNKIAPSSAYNRTEVQEKIAELSPTTATLGGVTKFIKCTIYNNTADTLPVTTYIGGTIIGIQEALNENGIWHPIEYLFNDRCGNSGSELELAPQHFVNFYIPRYYGNFKTKMRLRLILLHDVIFSNEWEGSIDKQQFEKPKEAYDITLKYFYDFLIRK